jgi:hypothetical protein
VDSFENFISISSWPKFRPKSSKGAGGQKPEKSVAEFRPNFFLPKEAEKGLEKIF